MKTMVLAFVLVFGSAAHAASLDILAKTQNCVAGFSNAADSDSKKLNCYTQALAEGHELMEQEFSLRKNDLREPGAVSSLESSQYVWRQSLGPKCYSSRQAGGLQKRRSC